MNLFIIRLTALVAITFFLLAPHKAQAGPVVLFDQSHGQQFLVEANRPLDLSGLAGVFAEQGAEIRTTIFPISDTVLQGVNVLIISGPFAPITPPEVLAIMKFVYHGGKLAIMAHISQPLLGLLPQMGIAMSSLAVSEQENIIGTNAKEFMVKDLAPHPLTAGLESFNIYGGWALLEKKKDITVIARTTHKAWVDLDQNGRLSDKDAVQAFAMVLTGRTGSGSFVVFGDDAIFQNQFLKDGNLTLARNLATWFCAREKSI
ncbi:MAG: GldG family protein [Proteobacteria bacterium]|nr:GldG family protein [Pseudomonadota bacterium]